MVSPKEYKYIEKSGFSLVELIIVIAIMAILIGVVALAVLPNIFRSRESKDLTTLDNILASTNIALANSQVGSSGSFEVDGSAPATGTDDRIIYDAISKELGDLKAFRFESSAAQNGGNLKIGWIITNPNAPHIVVQIGDGTVACEYTTGSPSDANGNRLLKVEAGTGGDPFTGS